MRVVLKPAGTLTLLSILAILCFLAFNDKRLLFGASSKASSVPPAPEGGMRFQRIDLTRLGKADWIQFGLTRSDTTPLAKQVVRKANVTHAIGPVEYVGSSPIVYTGDSRGFRWSDGDTFPNSPEARTGLVTSGVGSGFRFVVTPTVGKRQVLRVWVGGEKVRSKLMARMSDGSSLSKIDESYSPLSEGDFRSLYVIVFQASKPDQRVLCTYLLADAKSGGTVSLQAAALE